ncbi:hypothetical protein BT69DRAFT_1277196 [Atractiella rhizophila]|nr:hypothetical protein BT69DRAFT_1277196 [Atractiella rhizophila]
MFNGAASTASSQSESSVQVQTSAMHPRSYLQQHQSQGVQLPRHVQQLLSIAHDGHHPLRRIPDTPTAYMLYRSDVVSELSRSQSPEIYSTTDGREMQKKIALRWRLENNEVKKWYEDMAEYRRKQWLDSVGGIEGLAKAKEERAKALGIFFQFSEN